MSQTDPSLNHSLAEAKRASGRWLLMGLVSLLMLLTAFWWAAQAREQLLHARQELAVAQQQFEQAQRVASMIEPRKQLDARFKSVLEQASKLGLKPGDWVASHVDIRRQGMTREEANQVLQSTATRGDQLVEVKRFDLSATAPNEGLFADVADRDGAIQLSLRATRMLRTEETP